MRGIVGLSFFLLLMSSVVAVVQKKDGASSVESPGGSVSIQTWAVQCNAGGVDYIALYSSGVRRDFDYETKLCERIGGRFK